MESTATPVKRAASARPPPGANGFRIAGSTFIPIVTKKIGTNRSPTGRISSSILARRSVFARIRPAANAPMMVASPTRSATAASRTQHEGGDDADDRHGRRLEARVEQLVEVGFQADLEEQDDDADLGQGVEDHGLVDQPEDARPDDHSGEELAQHGRLAESRHRLARELRREPDDDQPDQELAQLHA